MASSNKLSFTSSKSKASMEGEGEGEGEGEVRRLVREKRLEKDPDRETELSKKELDALEGGGMFPREGRRSKTFYKRGKRDASVWSRRRGENGNVNSRALREEAEGRFLRELLSEAELEVDSSARRVTARAKFD